MAGAVDVILGTPGSGKTTQADRLALRRRYVHLSSGALLRAAGDAQAARDMQAGELVEPGTVEKLIQQSLSSVDPALPILLDGFPRTKGEAEWLQQALQNLGRELNKVIILEVGKDQALERLQQRGRSDDQSAAQAKRWQDYDHQTKPVIDFYRRMHKLVRVDGSGTPEQVTDKIMAAL